MSVARKIGMRSASLAHASDVLSSAGFAAASEFVLGLSPIPVSRSGAPVLRFRAVSARGDALARSARRAGLRYVARLLDLMGVHGDAATYLEFVASEIPSCDVLKSVSYARGVG
jgi:hypothetical protein